MAGEKPYISNGTTADPREQIMWDIYVKNLAKGIDNAMQASLEAGYEETTAKNITLTGWYKERKAKLKRKDMLSKAERNLDKVLDFEMVTDDGKVNTQVASLVIGVSTTIANTLGKDEGYTTRQELGGVNGKDLIPSPESKEVVEKAFGNI